MPTTTPNLGLTKDAEGEPYSLARINANNDRIDTFAGEALTDTVYDTTGTPALIKKRKIDGVETPVTIETPDTTPTEGSKHLITSDAVHAALGSKQDELSQSQLAAANSGITAEKLTADETALGEIINGGSAGTKNLFDMSGAQTFDVTGYGVHCTINKSTGVITLDGTNQDKKCTGNFNIKVSDSTSLGLIAGTVYKLTCDGYTTSDTTIGIYVYTSGATPVAQFDTYDHTELAWNSSWEQSNGFRLFVRGGTVVNNITLRPMLCRKALYDVNPDYEPYAPAKTNVEITPALVEVVDVGAKNCATVNNATYTNVNRWFNIDSICDKNCVLSLDSITSTDTNASTCALLFEFEDDTLPSKPIQLPRGTRYEREFSLAKNVKGLHIYASDTYNNSGTTNTVTITNLMLCTKVAWDISHKFVPYALPNPTLTPALIEQVDNGAKNFLTENTKTETGQWTNIPVVLQAGSYVLAIETLSSTDTDATTCQLGLFNSANQNLLGSYPQLNRGNNIVYSFEITSESSYLRVYSSDTTAHGAGDTVTVTNAMICTAADWAVSHKFVPYCPSMQEMYQMIIALQTGTRSAPALAKAEPEVEPETGEEEMR